MLSWCLILHTLRLIKATFRDKIGQPVNLVTLEGKEIIPPNAPPGRGAGFIFRAKVDADHATDTVTRRSRSGFVVYLNNALMYWFSKKQTSVESSSFGSEFCAMKLCCEYLRGLRYKLRMMGIPGRKEIFKRRMEIFSSLFPSACVGIHSWTGRPSHPMSF